MEEKARNSRKVREGVVVSNKMQKTVVVRVSRKTHHPHFEKVILESTKYYAHVDGSQPQVGQVVRIMETRPLSKMKRWRVVETLEGV